MADPTTTNVLLAIPTRGSDTGTWDVPVNGDFSAIDGYLGGVQTISVSSAPITLTAPTGTTTPSGGPTQAQNMALSFTGVMTANVQVTFSLPGSYIVENLTTGNFVLTFVGAGAGAVIAVDQGRVQRIYSDGTNAKYVGLEEIGEIKMWAGLSVMPPWVLACSKAPYLLCDGTVYNFSSFPYLGNRLKGIYGGNGITTFAVPDHRGRIALPYDGTGTRITTAGSGLSGNTLGASLDQQNVTLSLSQIPTGINVAGSVTPSGGGFIPIAPASAGGVNTIQVAGAATNNLAPTITTFNWTSVTSLGGTLTSNNTSGGFHPNVQPSLVTGISVIRAA